MFKKIQTIPSGTFLVPFFISVFVYSFWPNLFENIGGTTASLLSGSGTGVIIGLLVFSASTGIQFSKVKNILQHQGTLTLINLVWSIILASGFLYLFGIDGILGISSVAFVTTIIGMNPAVYSAFLADYGYKEDTAFYAIAGILCLPVIPLIIFSIYFSGGIGSIDIAPIISILIPMALGLLLGNIDSAFGKFFGPTISPLLFFLGWNLGQGLSVFDAIQAGLPGFLLAIIFMILMSVLYFSDKYLLGYEGISGIGMMTTAGLSTAVPEALGQAFPDLAVYTGPATAQVLVCVIITAVVTPVIVKRVYNTSNPEFSDRKL